MGAAASNIENHPQVAIQDSEGNAFPPGACFYLQNLCSDFKQSLKFDRQIPGAITCTSQDIEECKWQVEYSGTDRTKVAFKNPATGQYLAASKNAPGAPLMLSLQQVVWYVYKGAKPRTFWLSSSQFPDTFLQTWNNIGKEGATIGILAGQAPQFRGKSYSVLEEWTTGMSWRLEPAPEYWKWKAQQKGEPSENEQALSKRVEELEAQLKQEKTNAADVEKNQQDARKNAQSEADIKSRLAKLEQRERDVASKEEAAAKNAAELKKSEERQKKAEQRLKRSSNPTRAEHLATQEERDNAQEAKQQLDDESKQLRSDLEAAKKEAADLRRKLEQAERSSGGGSDALGSRRMKTSGFQWSVSTPSHHLPARTLPSRVNPKGRGELPPLRKVQPAQHIPKSFDSDMMKRFEAGKNTIKAEKASGL